jgi:hypothetical protein
LQRFIEAAEKTKERPYGKSFIFRRSEGEAVEAIQLEVLVYFMLDINIFCGI